MGVGGKAFGGEGLVLEGGGFGGSVREGRGRGEGGGNSLMAIWGGG